MNKFVLLCKASRPISWINTAYPFAAAYLVTVGKIDAIWLVGSLFFLIPYNVMMYGVNDVFDYESDRLNPRKNSIEGAVVQTDFHRFVLGWVAILTIPFVGWLWLQSPSLLSRAVLALVIFLVLAYSLPGLRFKERPIIDSMTSSMHFVGPMLYALTFTAWQPAYWLVAGAFFLWGMASHAFGAVQDIQADRRAGIGSLATVFGAARTVTIVIGLYVASALLLLPFGPGGWVIAAFELLYVANVWGFRGLKDSQAAQANRGWRRFIWLNWLFGAVVTMVLLAAGWW